MKENWYFDHTVIPRIFFPPKNNKKKGIFYTRKTVKSNVQTVTDMPPTRARVLVAACLGSPGATRIHALAVKFQN